MYKFKASKHSDEISNPLKFLRDGRAPYPETEVTSKIMSANKAKNTRPEIAFRKVLWENGIRGYRLHFKKVPGSPDIAFPRKKIAIFINGCFWHRCPYCSPRIPKSHSTFWIEKFERNVARDKHTIQLLQRSNWKTIILWECQIKHDIDKCIKNVKTILNDQLDILS